MITKISTENREAWKALRGKYIGGSDAASVVGLNPFSSPYALWAEKTGRTPPFEGNLATDVGTYLEDFVAKRFEAVSGKRVRRDNHSILNSLYPYSIANVDRVVVGEDCGLECKSTSALNTKRFRGGEFPTNYYCQCVHYLAITERAKWFLAVLIGNNDFRVYQLTRSIEDTCPDWCESSVYISDDEIAALMLAEAAFWEDHVLTGIPPAADGSARCAETIGQMYPASEDVSVSLMGYATELEQYMALSAQIKELEGIRDGVGNKIKAFMQEAARGETDRYRVSWATAERKSFDSKSFMKDHPELNFEKYYKTSSYRTFKVAENRI